MTTLAMKYRGQWPQLLMSMGVDERYLRNVHGPCPLCGGTDRYRFDNKNGEGTYYCNSCGAGDGVTLLSKLNNWDLRQVAHQLERASGEVPRDFRPAPKELSIAQRRRFLNEVWGGAKTPDVVDAYMAQRGLILRTFPDVRGSSDLRLEGQRVPGVVSMIRALDGSPVSLHRILLPPGGERVKKIMPPLASITGCAVRLDPAQNPQVLHVAEGIESAMAVAQDRPGESVWATISAHGMETLEVPDSVTQLVIWPDTDNNFVGQAAAFQLAKRMRHGKRVFPVHILMGREYGDPLDRLYQSGNAAAGEVVWM